MAKKVLVVDDELPILRLLEVNLSRAGYEVIQATDGVQGLEKMRQESPDLVVLDIVMPRMDGYEMLRRVHEDPSLREIPVIVLTALAQEADVYQGWQAGPTAYVTKPVSIDEFVSLVKRVENCVEAEPGGNVPLSVSAM